MLILDPHNLAILELSLEDLDNLSDEEKQRKIRKQYWKLSLQHHPDKQGEESKFLEIAEAYQTLTGAKERSYSRDINNYFQSETIEIPDTAFDLLLEEKIINAYESLIKEFTDRSTEKEKREFAEQHASFINLAQSLEKKQIYLNEQRGEYYFELMTESPLQKYKHEWRKLMISLFAEEYLDDFQYRHAIATGELGNLLALRKLFSPVKLLAALLNSVILAIRVLSRYLFVELILGPLIIEFQQHFNDIKAGNLHKGAAFLWVLKFIAVLAAILTPFILLPIPMTILLSLPLLGNALTAFACPVNKIIRPLAQYFGVSPYLVGPVLTILLGLSTFLFLYFFPITALASLITPAAIALTIYMLYGTAKLIKNLYDLNPAASIFQLVVTIISIGVGLLVNYLVPSLTPKNPLWTLIGALIGVCLVYQTNESLDNIKKEVADEVEILPLPQETISENLRETVLQQVKTSHYSTRFFNTIKEAPCIANKDRTIWQKTASFFGGGELFPPSVETAEKSFSSALLIEGY